MTSDEIKKLEVSSTYEAFLAKMAKEIAYQLAVMNERNAVLDKAIIDEYIVPRTKQ